MLKTNVTGETMVFAKDYNDRRLYSTTLGKKNQDGTWDNGYINLQFKKDVKLLNKTKIDIKNGWLTFYKSKDGKSVFYIFVNEFERLADSDDPTPDGFAQLADEIPF